MKTSIQELLVARDNEGYPLGTWPKNTTVKTAVRCLVPRMPDSYRLRVETVTINTETGEILR